MNGRIDLSAETDEKLYALALEKRKNGNGTPRAYAAQRELAKRHGTIKPHSSRADGSTKRFSYNEDYMGFETDNR
jgi:hypothetical protein